MWRWTRRGRLLLLLLLTGCGAAYTLYMGSSLDQLSQRNYQAALDKLERPEGKTNLLLYRLERGLILHYQGEYGLSNAEFDAAEQLIDDLYTRSASREVAALLTNDAIRAYRGEEFERVLINYYRALNYLQLGDVEGALVECRKANLKLEDYAGLTEYELSYKNDAFMQYLTGMVYEAAGETNDAYVSYRLAASGYQAYQDEFGIRPPRSLAQDLSRLAGRLGYSDDVARYRAAYGVDPDAQPGLTGGQVVVFVETGFIARKHQVELNLPILRDDDAGDVWVVSDRLVYRYRHPRAYRRASVKYWLRVALPEYRPVPSPVSQVRISGGGASARGTLVQDLDAIAIQTFAEKENTILMRTAARALAKYLAARGVRKAFEDDGDDDEAALKEGLGKLLGGLINLFGAATEAADTRGWLSLPRRIHMVRLAPEPGITDLLVEFLDGRGQPLETVTIPAVRVEKQGALFLNCRGYR